MNFWKALIHNFPLVCAGTAWLSAQILKVFTGVFKMREFSVSALLFGNGGMPSSHAALTCSLSTLIMIVHGFSSVEFAIAFCFTCVVIYDATGVRRETGRQARVLNKMMEEMSSKNTEVDFGKHLKELIGHSKTEVTVGCFYGVLIGVLYYFLIIKLFEVVI